MFLWIENLNKINFNSKYQMIKYLCLIRYDVNIDVWDSMSSQHKTSVCDESNLTKIHEKEVTYKLHF